ncbi:MAG: hypothetical protein P4L53_25975 [Candidatus Obscuribacterales bacterium]|nr:hypothetical protein [Candidatus Obscuribacterales bacterium]
MQAKTTTVAPALRALLDNFIDYAGIFPPATVSLDQAVLNYNVYKRSDYAWMLRYLVVNAHDIEHIPGAFVDCLSVLSNVDQTRVAALETKDILAAVKPVYCEVALNELNKLEDVKKSGCFAKIRTGGVKPEAIPSPKEVASFISECARLRLPFKATAGLHHPIRAMRSLTYDNEAPQAVMHGFINVLMAAAFAWNGEIDIEPIVAEQSAEAFSFDDVARWQGKTLNVAQIKESRLQFIHSVGTCSFDEPVAELKELQWLS